MCSKKRGSRSCKILSKDGMISCWNITRCRRGHKSCRAYKTKRDSAGRILGEWAGGSERVRNEIEEKHAKLQNKTSLAELELDEEIRNLQAGGERRGSCAAQSNGCCFDPAAVLELYISTGATQAWERLS